jgi:ABC-type glycerol-3-phosphate transport system substrate-binding protein
MRSRRRTRYAVLAATAVLSVGALGQASLAQSDAPPVTISWWDIPMGIVNVPGLEAETANNGDWERLMADRFTVAHPNVTIDYQLIAAEDITAKMAAAVLAGTPPDIYWDIQSRQSPYALEEGVIEDISALVGPETLATVDPDFIPLVTLGGQVYSLPTHVTPAGWLLYNKAIFADTGVAEPTDGQWSYADFDAALGATAIPDQRWPLAIRLADEQADTAWLGYLLGFGCRPFTEDFSASSMSTPECEAGLQWMADANAKGWMYPGVATIAFGDLDTAWASGQTVFSRFGFNDAQARIDGWTTEGKVTVPLEPALALYPHAEGVDQPGLILTVSGQQVFAQSDPYKREMIAEFLRFLSQPDVQEPMAKGGRLISAFTEVGNPNPDDPTLSQVSGWLDEFGPVEIGAALPQYTAIRQARIPLIQAAVLGEMPVADALSQIDSEVNALLAGG